MKDTLMIVLGILWIAFLLGDTVLLMWVARYLVRLVWRLLL